MSLILTRDATLGFTHGVIRIEVTGSQLDSLLAHNERLDAILRAATNVALNGLIPAICVYEQQCADDGNVKTGLDGFSHNLGASWLSHAVDVTVYVDLSIDLPNEHMKQLISHIMQSITQNAIGDVLRAQPRDLASLGTIADMLAQDEGMFTDYPEFVTALLSGFDIVKN